MARTKSASDIDAIRQTVVAMEVAVVAVISYLKTTSDPTSDAAHEEIDRVLLRYDCISPDGHIVASGPRNFEPHYKGEGSIAVGVPIVIDIYPQSTVSRFWADMTRTVCLGEPLPQLEAMYKAVYTVHQTIQTYLQPGALCDEIHQAALDQFTDLGYQTRGTGTEFKFSEGFVHSIGHGLGQVVHEEPFFGGARKNILQVGDVVTIEPGLYYKDIGGVRLEDLFLITSTGCERLTTLPYTLRVDRW